MLFIKHDYGGRTGKILQKGTIREMQKDYSKCKFTAGPADEHVVKIFTLHLNIDHIGMVIV